ncbi:MAG: PKD domain-containing protein, partial [Bacteroidales bacterium]|nr:PKD domain-containing protein [Bacteroidales bacterium]
QSTTHVYSTWGNLDVVLTVTDINGCNESFVREINIAQPPVADFSYSPVVCDSMQFTDLSTSPAGYNLVQWFWDFGDGVGTSTLQNPSYQYPSNTTPGGEVFMVTLTVVADSNGFICSDSIVLPVTVPSLPDIFYTFTPDPTCLGDTTFFYGESGFPIDVWQWDFDDGNFSNDQDATHIFTTTGDYDVVLTITDTNLCQNTLVNTVRVNDIPTVSFTVSDSVSCHGNQIGFISTVSSNVETWFWDFDDGSFSNDQNPVHYFPQGGNYNVSLTVTDSAGCSATFTDDVLILPGPTADFSYQNITCSSVLFTDLSTAPTGYTVTEWLWDFGDGFTSNIQNPSHSYTLGIGTYDVTLIVTADSSNYSCQDTIVQTIYTPGLPSVFFTWTPEPTMLGDLTSFFGTSGNTIIDWYWDFGDGNFATTQDATHTFATVGSFTVELTVTDIDGCQNSVIHQVTVTSIPELDFSWNYSCEGSPVQFTVLDPPTDLPAVVSFSWDFGDGGISDQQDPEHVYVTSGTYNVSLTIIDTMAATNTVVKQITVNPLPISLFSIGSQTCQGNDVSFTDYSTTQTGYITEWFWDFGDGNTQTVIFPNSGDVTHQYAATGNYVVTLTITNSDSCSNSSQNSVTILPSPTAMFTNTEGCQSTPIDFTDQSTQNGGGSIISWAWDFDDPGSGSDNTSTLQNPTHLFSSSGSFDVLLVVENVNGCIDSITMSVTVEANPEVDFTWDNACVDADVEFTSDYTGGDATYSWTFGDGGTSNLPNPTYSYTTPGDYTVTLTITTTLGCVASSSHTVEIHPLPNANFAHTGPACLNQEVEFTNLSTSPNGTIDTWVWDFGDGTTVTINAPASPDVTHLYANDGTFDVVLTVTDVEGCESSVTKQVIVVNSPIADFTYDESCYNEPVIFTDISTTNSGTDIQSWYWDFGDPASGTNNTSNLQNPSHVFTSPGTYTTTLIIVSTFGCSDTTTKDVEVEELPFAEIGMLDDSICLGELAEFTGTGSDISTWYWEFGDGGTSIEQNPSYMYAQTGIYIVSLTVTGTGTDQCTYTTDTTITVNDAPQADFSYENTCLGDSTYFTDLSYSQYGFISEWLWDFGDGSTSTLEDPSHVYLTNDDFQVTLIVTDNFGCSDTLSQWIQVFGSPIPSFSWDQVCDPVGQVNFFDQSTPGLDNSPIVGWEWHLDDGYFSTEIDPSYIYSIIDTCYTVTLTVTDNNGCYSTDTNTQVCLHGELEVDFTTDVVCENQSTLFTATYSPGSDSVASYSWNFNDGTPIVSTYYDTITHIFPNAGMYIVELTALDTNDCVATIYKEVMVDSLPTAQFTYDQGSCENPTEFTDISLGGGEFIQSWYWDFGDLTSSDNTSTLQNPTHMYPPNDSTYIVKLVITNFNGCMDSIEQQVFVDPCLIAGFVIPDTACARYEMCFRDTSSVASSTSQVSEWRWDFGDGTTYNYTTYDEYVCHTFSQAGDYPVELVILANIGGTTYSDTVTKMVRVNPTPVAIMDYTNGCFGDTTMFYDASASYGAPIIYYHWDLGDPNTSVDTSLMQDTMYVYPDYGTYYPELIVQNEFTCSDTIGDTITIYKLPTAEFSFEEQCMSYYTYFTDESTNDSSSISSWYWDFGHGTFPGDTSIDQDPVFIYDTTGVYTTSLIVTDANGCIDSTSRDIDIWPIPQTNFVVIDTNQQGQIYLDNLSQGGVDYYWDFDYDYGVSTTEKSPIHQYEVDGSYDIMLVSYNEYNCPDTMHQIYDLLFRNLFVPNAFIPSSSDQELRTFLPKGINLRSYTIEIYSSWGNRVFESTELNDGTPAEGWDGTYKDEPLPTGSYIWRISAVFEDGEYWKGTDNGDGNTGTSGTITLIR